MEPQHKFLPKSDDLTAPLDKRAEDTGGLYAYPMFNLDQSRREAEKRNRFYIALCMVCVIAVVFVTLTSHFKVYTVRVDNVTGRIDAAQELKAVPYKPQQKEIQYFLTQFVRDIRTIPLDPVVYKSSWNTAQHFLTTPASNKLATLIKNDDQIKKLGRSTVQVEIKSFQLQPNTKSTYQVRWQEREFSAGGEVNKDSVRNYIAVFAVSVQPPKDEKELNFNPLGLKITDLNIAREN